MKALEWSQHFSHYKFIFAKTSRAINSAVSGSILPNFELIRDLVVVIVTCIRSQMKVQEWLQESVDTDNFPDGRQLDGYTISSPCELLAQVS